MTITLGELPLRRDEVVAIARGGEQLVLSPDLLERLRVGRLAIDAFVADEKPVYGVSTGFGSLATTFIPSALRADLQQSLIRSHAAGMGAEVEREVVRAMMVSRLTNLVSGVAGVRPETAVAYVGLLNAGITPVVYEYGSLGCSGDLAPLAHVALALMGEGHVRTADGTLLPAAEALSAAGLAPVALAEKEGLALINGTDGMLGQLILALADIEGLLLAADVIAAVSIQALRGTDQVFRPEVHALRPHRGQCQSAATIFAVMAHSPIVASHLEDPTQVQDAYSLRCAPQVHGSARDAFAYATGVAEIELVSSIDNPSILPSGELASNGNFHGAPVAHALDFLAIVLADVASIAERRTDRMLDPSRSFGLPPFLAHQPGVDSGLMIAQYTQAGLVAEMKRLAVPASVDSIPSSGMQEDHVSMGWSAARKLRRSVDALAKVVAIELVTAARAMGFRAPLVGSPVTEAIVRDVVALVGPLGPDRYLAPELTAVEQYVMSGGLAAHVAGLVKGGA